MDAVSIATSALDVEWRRVEIAAQNLANLNSTRTAGGEVYRPLRLLSGPMESFQSLVTTDGMSLGPTGVRITSVEAQANGLRRAFEPNNPAADADGFVTYPNIDNAAEMTTMIRASRAYEANLAAINIAVGMYSKALEIGR